eukprot:977111-Rhodomonas_salina.2
MLLRLSVLTLLYPPAPFRTHPTVPRPPVLNGQYPPTTRGTEALCRRRQTSQGQTRRGPPPSFPSRTSAPPGAASLALP